MTEEELLAEKAKTEGARIGYTWMKRHLTDFDRSEESAAKIGNYLKVHDLELSEENLEKAFLALKAEGVSFTTAPVPAAPAVPVEEPLPPVPEYMEHIRTKADITKCKKYAEWLLGKHGLAFRARVNEILRRGK